jgi:hypothetical protein
MNPRERSAFFDIICYRDRYIGGDGGMIATAIGGRGRIQSRREEKHSEHGQRSVRRSSSKVIGMEERRCDFVSGISSSSSSNSSSNSSSSSSNSSSNSSSRKSEYERARFMVAKSSPGGRAGKSRILKASGWGQGESGMEKEEMQKRWEEARGGQRKWKWSDWKRSAFSENRIRLVGQKRGIYNSVRVSLCGVMGVRVCGADLSPDTAVVRGSFLSLFSLFRSFPQKVSKKV